MAKDKSKKDKKKDKGKKGKDVTDVQAEAPVDPMEAAGVLDTDAGIDGIITDLTNIVARLKAVNVATDDTPAEVETPAPEKGKKKGKKAKDEDAGSDDGEAIESTVSYTEKALNKIGDKGAEGRKELVGILTSLGVSEDELKGKRWTTLVSLILTKQEEAKSGSADEFQADAADGADDGWEEDVPPADDKKKGKKKKKSKK